MRNTKMTAQANSRMPRLWKRFSKSWGMDLMSWRRVMSRVRLASTSQASSVPNTALPTPTSTLHRP